MFWRGEVAIYPTGVLQKKTGNNHEKDAGWVAVPLHNGALVGG
jgi:hypothetical protein